MSFTNVTISLAKIDVSSFQQSDTFSMVDISSHCLNPGIRKMVKHTLKILEHLVQDFYCVFDHFGEARHCRFNH